jgi:hypothetical protein
MKKIVLTPISINNPDAQQHYQFEMAECQNFRPGLWTGDGNAKDQEGDYFGFVDVVSDTIQVTKIIGILGASASRKHWSGHNPLTNSGTGYKNTIIFDGRFQLISYSKYKQDAGYKPNLVLNTNKRLDWPY